MATLENIVHHPFFLPILYGVVLVLVLPLLIGYLVLLERKIMADMQARLGPMRVGPHGLLQPLADGVKLMLKEDITPTEADRWIFWVAPIVTFTAGMTALAAVPFGPGFQVADLNVGLLFVVAVSALGIFGIVLGGWASNSHYSLLGALRSAAQIVSYEVAGGMALVSGLLLGGSLSLRRLVEAQHGEGAWFVFLAPVGFFIYFVASVAETNRAPFDLPEAESELVAGFMTEYSGFRWVIFMMAETANMIVVASVATVLFLGGWLRPFASTRELDFLDYLPPLLFLVLAAYCFWRTPKQPVGIQKGVMALFALICLGLAGAEGWALTLPAASALRAAIHGGFWFLLKVFLYLYSFYWIRFTFPRYRFDQLMRLGWQFLIPVAIVHVLAIGSALLLRQRAGWGLWPAMGLATLVTLLVAAWLAGGKERPAYLPSEPGG